MLPHLVNFLSAMKLPFEFFTDNIEPVVREITPIRIVKKTNNKNILII